MHFDWFDSATYRMVHGSAHHKYAQYKQKGFAPILILVGILIMAAVAGGAYYFGKSQTLKPQSQNPVVTSQAPQPATTSQLTPTPKSLLPTVTENNEELTPEEAKQVLPVDETVNWKIYTNDSVGFSFKFPLNWSKKDLLDNGKADGLDAQGLQGVIHIVWGSGFGGGCPQGFVDIPIQNGTLKACNRGIQQDGSYIWQIYKDLTNITIFILATANPPLIDNKPIILKVLSTFRFDSLP